MKDSNTQSLFTAIFQPGDKMVDEMPIPFNPAPKQVFDTQQITDIYMQRPVSIQTMRMGAWFAGAHCLQDWELKHCVGTSEARRHIIAKGYNCLSLEPLEAFNKAWKNKGE